MIPEFSYCESNDSDYPEGLYKSNQGVVHTIKNNTLECVLDFWLKEWNSFPWYYSEPIKLLLPGGLI